MSIFPNQTKDFLFNKKLARFLSEVQVEGLPLTGASQASAEKVQLMLIPQHSARTKNCNAERAADLQ
ncbi:hypothetical protein H6G00_22360 [Leptolyngbya sp. FACHB-541]|uniref:hypothetical protein n=1 Tax=Leptolyngbya sp. FACHB-541 TaxID=2692810 RepID=UPI00168449FD|nr:hypothetical protein [Leptolyngbya sp. FACHB-541]MBD1999321.1 hypothetical protein [Leptolyngbya sp. FACHB-541]